MRPSDPRLRSLLRSARRPLAGVVGFGAVSSLLVIAQAWAVTGVVVTVVRHEALAPWLLFAVAVVAARAVVSGLSDVCAAQAAAVVGSDLRRRLVAAVLRTTGSGTPTPASGELAVLTTRGVAAVEPYLTRYVPALVLASVLPVLTVAAMASQDLLSAVIVLATLPLVPVFGALVGLATRDRAEEQWRAMASLSGHFVDVVRGLPTLVVHRRADAQSETIRSITHRYRRASMRTLRLAFASSMVLELVATLSVALVAVSVGVRLAAGHLDLHTALVVLLLAPEAYWPLRKVGAEFHAAAEGVATFEAVDALVTSAPAATRGTAAPPDAALQVSDLTVVHPGRTVPALDHLTATVPARGVTVVTGPSGCGKSTLLGTLAGLLAPTTGTVLVGGVAVGGVAWQSQVAWLPQRPVFVPGSVADNLRLGAPAASDEDLWSALVRVALAERVRDLPQGLGTALDEDGVNLSAGERARLALARIVLADRPWVLLDEPTAHLDPLTEQVIADTIVELGQVSGVVVVAHRPALVELADRVVPLPSPRPRPTATPVVPPGRARVAQPVEPDVDATASATRRGLVTGTLVGALASGSGVALTATAGWLIVQASSRPPVLTLLVAIVAVRAFGLARPVLRYVERLRSHDAALRLLAERRVEVFESLVPLTPGRLGRRRGDLLSSVVDDVESVVDRELRVRMPVRSYALVVLAAAGLAATRLPLAGLATLVAATAAGAGAYAVARLGGARTESLAVRRRAELSEQVVQVVQTAPELVMWQAERANVDRVGQTSAALGVATLTSGRWLAVARCWALLAGALGLAGVALLAGRAVDDGTLNGPMAALLVLLPLAISDLSAPLADAGALAARTRAAAGRLAALARTEPAVADTGTAPVPVGTTLELADLGGGWDQARRAVRGLSLVVPPGGRVAVSGTSGSGKSTLAALLLRFIDPVTGDLTLGGTSLHRMPLDAVRRTVGLVDDDPHVFATTVAENVRFARPDADDADVAAALGQARLNDWLATLPNGLHTWLGDGHALVSGGERARIGLARALLADQQVLVLDEPAAHLDHTTATEIVDQVLRGLPGRTVVWIGHDPVDDRLVDLVVDLGAGPGGISCRGGGRRVAPAARRADPSRDPADDR